MTGVLIAAVVFSLAMMGTINTAPHREGKTSPVDIMFESVLQGVLRTDQQQCLLRLFCEIGSDRFGFGSFGKRVANIFASSNNNQTIIVAQPAVVVAKPAVVVAQPVVAVARPAFPEKVLILVPQSELNALGAGNRRSARSTEEIQPRDNHVTINIVQKESNSPRKESIVLAHIRKQATIAKKTSIKGATFEKTVNANIKKEAYLYQSEKRQGKNFGIPIIVVEEPDNANKTVEVVPAFINRKKRSHSPIIFINRGQTNVNRTVQVVPVFTKGFAFVTRQKRSHVPIVVVNANRTVQTVPVFTKVWSFWGRSTRGAPQVVTKVQQVSVNKTEKEEESYFQKKVEVHKTQGRTLTGPATGMFNNAYYLGLKYGRETCNITFPSCTTEIDDIIAFARTVYPF